MDLSHVHVFTAALQRKDLDTMLAQMSERIILETPLFAEPVRGKVAIREAVGALLAIVERIQFQEILAGPQSASGFYKVTIGSETLDGMDYWQLDTSGLIEHMRVLWRPLPALVAAQRRLAEAH